MERFLFRLSKSKHVDSFVLKGALLFLYWYGDIHRPTLDVDLLAVRQFEAKRLREIAKKICEEDVKEDGLVFHPETVKTEIIREGTVYGGVRVKMRAKLGNADVPLHVDVGFGDSLAPGTDKIEYPTILNFPSPKLLAYKPVTSIGEKCQFMIDAGVFNSRMKDYYDIWFLSNQFEFEGLSLQEAIRETFKRRKTQVPFQNHSSLSSEFFENEQKQNQWRGFLNNLDSDQLSLETVITDLREFLFPVFNSISKNEAFRRKWVPGEGWKDVGEK
ncbi:MAG: nucleotidyl transferase AbiEii/AbiGii toxin family protein [Candidatus Acetothermia bacterium]